MSHKSAALIYFAAEAWNHAYFWTVTYIETGTDLDGSGGGENDDGHLAIGFKVQNKRHTMKSNIGMETTYDVFSSSAGDGNELPCSHCHSLWTRSVTSLRLTTAEKYSSNIMERILK
jgi:hypothetical protein